MDQLFNTTVFPRFKGTDSVEHLKLFWYKAGSSSALTGVGELVIGQIILYH